MPMKINTIVWEFLTPSQKRSVRDKVRKTKDKKLISRIFNESEELIVAALQNPLMKTHPVDSLVDHPNRDVREHVAEITLNPEILAKLAYDKSEDVVASVACNRNFNSLEAMRYILKKWKNSHVPRYLIQNKSCPEEILIEAARGKDVYLISSVINSERLPVKELERLSRSKRESIRESIAELESAPLHLKMKLAKDPELDVRRACLTNLRHKDEDPLYSILIHDEDEDIREDVFRYCKSAEILALGLENEKHPRLMNRILQYGKRWELPRIIGTEKWEAAIFKFLQMAKEEGARAAIPYLLDDTIEGAIEDSKNVSLLFEAYSVVEDEEIKQRIKRMIDDSGELENWAISLDEWT